MQSESVIKPANIPPIPPVKRARLSWWQTIPHTISIYYQLRMARFRVWFLEWIGVEQLIRNEVNARQAADATNTGLINRVANQGNQIARMMPALVAARKRLEFYEQDEILRHAKKRFDKANARNNIKLEKINDRGDAQRNGSRPGTGNEVPESPRPDAEREAGQGEVRGETSDGAEVGRPEIQVDAATRHGIISELMDSDEATANMGARTLVKCDLCEATDARAQPGDPCPCGGGTYRLLLRATRRMTPGHEGDNLP